MAWQETAPSNAIWKQDTSINIRWNVDYNTLDGTMYVGIGRINWNTICLRIKFTWSAHTGYSYGSPGGHLYVTDSQWGDGHERSGGITDSHVDIAGTILSPSKPGTTPYYYWIETVGSGSIARYCTLYTSRSGSPIATNHFRSTGGTIDAWVPKIHIQTASGIQPIKSMWIQTGTTDSTIKQCEVYYKLDAGSPTFIMK